MTRRELLGLSSLGFGQIALSHLLAQTSEAAQVPIYIDITHRAENSGECQNQLVQLSGMYSQRWTLCRRT